MRRLDGVAENVKRHSGARTLGCRFFYVNTKTKFLRSLKMATDVLGYRDIIGKFYAALAATAMGWTSKIAMLIESDQPSEEYKWLGMAPAMREWIGARMLAALRDSGMLIRNKDFEASIVIPKKDIRRDKTGQIDIRINDLARRANAHWAKLLSTFIANGTGQTSGLAYDGQYFFDTDHSEGDSGTQLNLLAAAQVPALDVTTATAPTPLEVSKAVLGVIAYMLSLKDDQGEPINEDAKGFLVMTSPVLWPAFASAFSLPMLDSGASNILVNLDGFTLEVVPNPRLTYTTQFATFRTDAVAKPLIMQDEFGIQSEFLGEGSDYAFDNNAYKFGVQASRNVGYGMWQYAAHATLS